MIKGIINCRACSVLCKSDKEEVFLGPDSGCSSIGNTSDIVQKYIYILYNVLMLSRSSQCWNANLSSIVHALPFRNAYTVLQIALFKSFRCAIGVYFISDCIILSDVGVQKITLLKTILGVRSCAIALACLKRQCLIFQYLCTSIWDLS